MKFQLFHYKKCVEWSNIFWLNTFFYLSFRCDICWSQREMFIYWGLSCLSTVLYTDTLDSHFRIWVLSWTQKDHLCCVLGADSAKTHESSNFVLMSDKFHLNVYYAFSDRTSFERKQSRMDKCIQYNVTAEKKQNERE